VTFAGLVLLQIRGRPLRAGLTAFAVAIGVTAVVALGVLTSSLRVTATQLLKVGTADFTVAQKHTDDLINSTIAEDDIAALRRVRLRQPTRHLGRTGADRAGAFRRRHPEGP
jgi:hypothetical protein